MTAKPYCAVYDFELLPYALGDVLTWNVQTAIRCRDIGRDRVDIYICMDQRYPVSMYQWDLVRPENQWLFFNELFGAFGTHPCPGNIHIFRNRDELLDKLREIARDDPPNAAAIADYERTVANKEEGDALVEYFTRYVHSHQQINDFFRRQGRIPLLRPSAGCEPDVSGLLARRFAGKKIVPFHLRLRKLDVGYGGEHSYDRDSDFLEWYEFLRTAAQKHRGVQFIALGRLQEKPLELLRLPNVASLRTYGLSLGHELTLALRSDLFIGSSSGFGAMANFSAIPYFITRMNAASCKAYGIDMGVAQLPFATGRQRLVYEPETRELLMRLLEEGLKESPPGDDPGSPAPAPAIDVRGWEWERSHWMFRNATANRFFADDRYSDKESAYLLWPNVRQARLAFLDGRHDEAWEMLRRIEVNFPRACESFPEFLRLKLSIATAREDPVSAAACRDRLAWLAANVQARSSWPWRALKYLAWGYPVALMAAHKLRRLKYFWRRRHRIPRKLAQVARMLLLRLTQS